MRHLSEWKPVRQALRTALTLVFFLILASPAQAEVSPSHTGPYPDCAFPPNRIWVERRANFNDDRTQPYIVHPYMDEYVQGVLMGELGSDRWNGPFSGIYPSRTSNEDEMTKPGSCFPEGHLSLRTCTSPLHRRLPRPLRGPSRGTHGRTRPCKVIAAFRSRSMLCPQLGQ